MRSYERGSGQTSGQMLAAPRGALFIWGDNNVEYPRGLARSLGRGDLRIERLSVLDDSNWYELQGHRFSKVVLDHAAMLNERQWQVLSEVRASTVVVPVS